jgi:hypothetical protein
VHIEVLPTQRTAAVGLVVATQLKTRASPEAENRHANDYYSFAGDISSRSAFNGKMDVLCPVTEIEEKISHTLSVT